MRALVTGTDPGLVHTGFVGLVFNGPMKVHATAPPSLHVWHHAITGPDAFCVKTDIQYLTERWGFHGKDTVSTFVEAYKPRSHFSSDARMVKAVHDIKAMVPSAKVIPNTGVKKVVRQPLMEALNCWNFTTSTHHQDLRSAARIAILGMMKDEKLNELLADFTRDFIDGRLWRITTN